MNVSIEALVQDLKNIVGEKYVYEDLFERINYADTLLPYDVEKEFMPDVVIQPGNAQEVSRVLAYATEHNVPVTTYGSGTDLVFPTKPKHRGITMSTERMDFLEINEEYQYVECGPGLKTGKAIKALGKLGYFLPIQTQAGSSIGGAVSINTIGHLADNIFGRPIHNVLGLEVVLPNGEIIETGSKCLRRSAGWDLGRIFIGSEGMLGVITKVRMILVPMPETIDAVGFFKTDEEVGHVMTRMYQKKLPLPMDGEFVGTKACKLGCDAYGLDFPEGALAVVKAMGRTKEEAISNAQEVVDLFKSEGATKAFVIEDQETAEKVWAVRENVMRWGEEKGKKGGKAIEVNPVLPRMSEAIRSLEHITEGRTDLIAESEAYLYGHVGSGSLHCYLTYPHGWPIEKMKRFVDAIWNVEKELQLQFGGVGGDWGWFPHRLPLYRETYGETSYAIIKKMKQLFDPSDILNRGNLEGEV
ncbi:MAG: FAD-binding oxidoreductase [Deltaproteobacteria bacterium]|nr:FAD-binding oxidoreductase [Deltaproteobacteria bacterium]